jgi:hypothetical protein
MKDFTLYPEASELEALGFDEPCLGYYHTTLGSSDIDLVIGKTPDRFYHLIRLPEHFDTLAPTFSQAFRFFREKYGLFVEIKCCNTKIINGTFEIEISRLNDKMYGHYGYETYEEAELACLIKLIEIVKNK